MKVREDLKRMGQTESGLKLLKSNSSTVIELIDKGGSQRVIRRVNGQNQEVVNLNINGDGFVLARGENTYVELKGLRLLAHEFAHVARMHKPSLGINPSYEIQAMKEANKVVKQDYLRLNQHYQSDFDILPGVRTNYGGTEFKYKEDLPDGAIIKL